MRKGRRTGGILPWSRQVLLAGQYSSPDIPKVEPTASWQVRIVGGRRRR
jgi:hypothetical protein